MILELDFWKHVMEEAELSDETEETLTYDGKIAAQCEAEWFHG